MRKSRLFLPPPGWIIRFSSPYRGRWFLPGDSQGCVPDSSYQPLISLATKYSPMKPPNNLNNWNNIPIHQRISITIYKDWRELPGPFPPRFGGALLGIFFYSEIWTGPPLSPPSYSSVLAWGSLSSTAARYPGSEGVACSKIWENILL